MRSVSGIMSAVGVMALCASSAMAQREGQQRRQISLAPSPLILLGQKSVQDDLKLTDEQVTSVDALSRKQRTAIQSSQDLEPDERDKKRGEMQKESEKEIATVLKPDQAKRLNQIHMQLQGAEAFEKPEVAKDLKLTDDQKSKIKTMREDAQKEMRAGGRQQGGDRAEARKKMQEANKVIGDKIISTVLNDDQKTKWKEMNGEPFKGEIRQPGRQGGGGQGGGGR